MVDQLLQNQVDILKLIQYIKKKKGGNIKCNIKQITTKLRFSPSSSYYDVESEYDNLIYKLEVHNVSEYQIMKLKSCLAKLGNKHRNILQFLYLLQGNPLAVDIDDEETMESYSTTIENESSFTFNQPYTGDHWEKEIYYTSDSENEIEENNEHYVDIHSNSDEEDDSCLKNKKSFGLSKNGFSTLKTVKEFIHKLERNRYWDRKYNAHIDIGGAHAENKTYNTFEFCNPLSLNLNSKKIFVTELELIYDCLLFLNVAIMGYTEDFKTNKNKTFYLNEGNVYQVSMDLVLTHVSEKSLWNTLFEFSKFGNMFQRLNYFILRSMDISSCQTIKALGFSVREEILIYWKWLNRIFEFYKINRKDRREKFSTSLLELYELITLSLSSLKELDVFLVNLSFELEKQNSNSKISTTILNFLFEEITKQQFLRRLEERNISEDLHQDLLIFKINFTEKKSFVFLLFTLLKKTLIPYLKILGGWIKNGRLDDPFSEFFISRNREIESNNEQFDWNAKYFIKKEKDQNLLLIPKIFLNSYNEILSLGKTIKLVELIEKLIIANQETNFKFFVNEAEKEGFFENFNFFSAVEKFFDNFMNKNDFNVLDRKNFNQFCVHNDDLSSVNNIKGITTAIGNTRAIPFEIVTVRIKEIISNRLKTISKKLKNFYFDFSLNKIERSNFEIYNLKNFDPKFNLKFFFLNLQNLFFFFEGLVFNLFFDELFKKLRLGQLNSIFLNSNQNINKHFSNKLKNLVEEIYCNDEKSLQTFKYNIKFIKFNIKNLNEEKQLNKKKKIEKNNFNFFLQCDIEDHLNIFFEQFEINYEIPWPYCIIITKSNLEDYKMIFNLIFEFKFVLSILREINQENKCSVKQKKNIPKEDYKSIQNTANLFVRFRLELFCFVERFFSFLMTSVLHANSIKFLNEVEKLNSLDEILLYHKKFLENLLISCCLTEKDDKVNQNSVDEKFDFRKGSYYNKVLNKLRIEFITLKEFHLSMLIGLGSLGDEKFSQAAYYTDL